MTIVVRHPTMDDLAAATEVLNAHSRALYGTDDTTVAELDDAWTSLEVTFPDDVFLAEVNGDLVGYADVIRFGKSSWIDVRATNPPAYEPLIEVSVDRAQEQEPEHIRAFSGDEDAPAREAFERAGFQAIRYGFRMMVDLEEAPPEPRWPDGFTVRSFRDGDGPAFHRAHQESFADTWEFTAEPYEQWSHWFMRSAFQPEHWFAVEHDGELAAVALCRVSDTEEDTGWVRILGVLPRYRRRGLALALLQHVFRHFADHGMKRVGLGVDAENPTGAVALYERAGMYVSRRNVNYELVRG
jgi:mycothiol synthase